MVKNDDPHEIIPLHTPSTFKLQIKQEIALYSKSICRLFLL